MPCVRYVNFVIVTFLPRDALHKRGLCRYAMSVWVSVCLCVCPSRLWILSKRVIVSSEFFSPWGSQTILVFAHQTLWRYSNGDPFNGGDSEPISGFTACCITATGQLLSIRRGAARTQVVTLIAGSKRRSLLIVRDDDEMFMARSLIVTPKTTEQHVITHVINL